MKTYKGTNASPGWSSSKAFFFNSELNFQKEVKYDFETGLKLLNKKYIELISNLNSSQREVESEIITAYKLILNDPEILSNCRLVDSRDIIGIYDVFISTAEIISSLEGDYLKQRSEDILSIGKELIMTMQNTQINKIQDEEVIVVAKDLTPNDTSVLNLKKVKGFIVENAGLT